MTQAELMGIVDIKLANVIEAFNLKLNAVLLEITYLKEETDIVNKTVLEHNTIINGMLLTQQRLEGIGKTGMDRINRGCEQKDTISKLWKAISPIQKHIIGEEIYKETKSTAKKDNRNWILLLVGVSSGISTIIGIIINLIVTFFMK